MPIKMRNKETNEIVNVYGFIHRSGETYAVCYPTEQSLNIFSMVMGSEFEVKASKIEPIYDL